MKLSHVIYMTILGLVLISKSAFAVLYPTSVQEKYAAAVNCNGLPWSDISDYKASWGYTRTPADDTPVPSGQTFYNIFVWSPLGTGSFWSVNDLHCLWTGIPKAQSVPVNPGDTWRDLEERWMNNNPPEVAMSSPYHGSLAAQGGCMVFGAAFGFEGGGSNISLMRFNGNQVCITAPPGPDPSCSVNRDVLLDFGTLASEEVNGKRVQDTVMLNCNIAASVTLVDVVNVQPGIVKFDWGTVTVKVNDNNLPAKISAVEGATALTFSADISAQGNIAPGDYSASFPLIINYQ